MERLDYFSIQYHADGLVGGILESTHYREPLRQELLGKLADILGALQVKASADKWSDAKDKKAAVGRAASKATSNEEENPSAFTL